MSSFGIGAPASSPAFGVTGLFWQISRSITISIAPRVPVVAPGPAATPVSAPQAPAAGRLGSPSGTPVDTLQSDYAALFQAVQAGDMDTALQALASIDVDRSAVSGSGAYGPREGSRIARDYGALAQAVRSGDTAGAQSALATLLADVQARHHHHHHHDEDSHEHGGDRALPQLTAPPVPVPVALPPVDAAGVAQPNDGERRSGLSLAA